MNHTFLDTRASRFARPTFRRLTSLRLMLAICFAISATVSPVSGQSASTVRPEPDEGFGGNHLRHFLTTAADVSEKEEHKLEALPRPVTSFGAAVIGRRVFLYGGHAGGAHSYSTQDQSNQLSCLNLDSGKWKVLADGPHLQGLALVPHAQQLFRLGGFTALNAEGEEHRLESQATVARFDPATGKWTELPDLPEPRSSHDAAVVGGVIYVVGGWKMVPGDDTVWHSSAWKMHADAISPKWEPIADPPFQRRALALAAHNGKLYTVGGMDKDGGPTTAVAIYDPESDSWSDGPVLQVLKTDEDDRMSSGRMAGFGASAFATGGNLYVTTVQGVLQRLTADGQAWEVIRSGLSPRFFHRMLPAGENSLVVVGGSNMRVGKFDEVELIKLSADE